MYSHALDKTQKTQCSPDRNNYTQNEYVYTDFEYAAIRLALDPEIKMLRGEFLGLSGGADFYAKSFDELLEEGRKSLTVFLEVCKEKNISPFREFSGRFNVRLALEIHETAVIAAAAHNKSLNDWVTEAIELALQE